MPLMIFLKQPIILKDQAQKDVLVDEISIDRIVDEPPARTVAVWCRGSRIVLRKLSGNNYDVPAEWTKADIIAAVKEHFNVT